MGGNAWQSTGCLTCRKRKIKCDKQEPECERCIKRGVQCPGYETFRIFFHQEIISTKEGKPANSRTPPATQLQNGVGAKPSETSDNNNPTTKTIYYNRARPITFGHNALDSGPSKRVQLFASYLNTYFPIDIKGTTGIDPSYGLISGISALPNKSPMLEKALAAQTCIVLGRQQDKCMFHHGLQLYNSAIQHMSHAIKRNTYRDDVVYTAAIFHCLISTYCPYGLDVWLNQMTVTSGILKHYSLHTSSDPLVKTLYLGFNRMRMLQALSPLQSKEKIILGENQVPSIQGLEKHPVLPIDELLNLMSEIAPLAAIIDTDNDSAYCGSHTQKPLIACLVHRTKLLAWYMRRKEDIGGGPIPCSSSELITRLPNAEHLFGPPYRFSSPDNARMHVLFWTALSILQALIGQAQLLPPAAGEYLLSEFYADEIGRALPFCLQNSMKAWGGHITVFGVGHISKVYLDFKRREKFFWSLYAYSVQKDMGSDFAGHLASFLEHSWNMKEKEDSVHSSSPLEGDIDDSLSST
ncbi:hypothetical protein N7448_005042 [Penicillium atrosanguineum]|uniref:uncharacterized protein n=1 Tax=Penicillium atrosanguineum TaxID=1132637 RepID=UPI00239C57AD|nr:uncharacterized protein N7443_008772 [Penicillium atrosanguineum]KAJ5125725.1 hypothetical protein N7526_007902 [Penicillium atrosanguineum]KAJ5136488.1 hypothetical protein N7448_005042 [Penicillium atrosanguineum]KAJ5292819.1 hypothetical protein N7443_008772 [Penicillium atrosanguineum]